MGGDRLPEAGLMASFEPRLAVYSNVALCPRDRHLASPMNIPFNQAVHAIALASKPLINRTANTLLVGLFRASRPDAAFLR